MLLAMASQLHLLLLSLGVYPLYYLRSQSGLQSIHPHSIPGSQIGPLPLPSLLEAVLHLVQLPLLLLPLPLLLLLTLKALFFSSLHLSFSSVMRMAMGSTLCLVLAVLPLLLLALGLPSVLCLILLLSFMVPPRLRQRYAAL